jgi:hypothetical protein
LAAALATQPDFFIARASALGAGNATKHCHMRSNRQGANGIGATPTAGDVMAIASPARMT